MSVIPPDLRLANWRRAGGCYEYCLIHEEDWLVLHQPDHIIAEQHGGQAVLDNLALACIKCNRLKGPNIASIDPETGQGIFLFHPRRDKWSDHFKLEGARIAPLTATGRATATLLKFNVPERVESRQLLMFAGRYPH